MLRKNVLAVTVAVLTMSVGASASVPEKSTELERVRLFLVEVAQEMMAGDLASLSHRFDSSLKEKLEARMGFEDAVLRVSAPLSDGVENSPVAVEIRDLKTIDGEFHVSAFIGEFATRTLVIQEVDGQMLVKAVHSDPTPELTFTIKNYSEKRARVSCVIRETLIEPGRDEKLECINSECHWWFYSTDLINTENQSSADCYWKRFRDIDASVSKEGKIECTEQCKY